MFTETHLKEKVVQITGAGSGIGRAAALAFARRGARIVAVDTNVLALEALQGELETVGVQCLTRCVDVSNENAVMDCAAWASAVVGAPHVLVNNAGIGYLGQFLKSDLAHWQRVLNINLMGVVHGCRHFLPMMLEAGGPRQVLNVASTAGIYPAPAMAAYAASKFTVFGFSEVLKMKLASSAIGITTVCPGIINTRIAQARSNVAESITDAQFQKIQSYYATKGCSAHIVGEAMVRRRSRGRVC